MTDKSLDQGAAVQGKKWPLLLVFGVALLLSLATWFYLNAKRSNNLASATATVTASALASFDTGKPYLEATLPSRATDGPNTGKTITFYIPKAYVDYSRIYIRPDKSYTVPINFELPERTPSSLAPPRPWRDLRHDGPEAKALKETFYKTHLGSFHIELGFGVGSAEQFLRKRVNKTDPWDNASDQYVQLSSVNGLLRYAQLTCYEVHTQQSRDEVLRRVEKRKEYLKSIARQSDSGFTEAEVQSQTYDPPIPFGCVIERLRPTLFTPLGTPEEEQLYVDSCDLYVCNGYISVAGVDGKLYIPLALLPRWREIALPAQELLRSFLIKPTSATATLSVVSSPNTK